MLPDDSWLERIAIGVPRTGLNWADALSYLPLDEAAELVARLVERSAPGYRQYLPATTFELPGEDLARIIAEHYPGAELRRPLAELNSLVDDGFAAELGLKMRPRVKAVFVDIPLA
jgi:hypothetical protein